MDEKYFNENEQNDLQLLYEFNTQTRLFDSITPTKVKAQYDATAVHKNRNFAIELKKRNIKLGTFPTIMIEDYKFLELLMTKQFENKEPLYINILLDDTIVIYNLAKLKHKPKFKNLPIQSKGYEKEQYERRYYLPIEDGVIYIKENGKYIQKEN